MKTIGLPSWARIKEVPVGGLITPTKNWVGAIGIIAARLEDLSYVGWLANPIKEMVGKCSELAENDKVFSFPDWVLEADLSMGLASPSNTELGVPYIGRNGIEIFFAQDRVGPRIGYSQKGAKPSDITELLTVSFWRIWASEEARYQAETPPLIDRFQAANSISS